MEHFEIIKMTIDILLVMAVMGLALCFAKSSSKGLDKQAGKIIELAGMLKNLVKQADSSGRSLNDQLLKRRSEMEKLLYEIESVESRINNSITSAEEQRSLLEIQAEKSKAQVSFSDRPSPSRGSDYDSPYSDERPGNYSVAYDSPASLNPHNSYSSAYSNSSIPQTQRVAEPASFNNSSYSYAPITKAKSHSSTNIYGEVLEEPSRQTAYGLNKQLEKTREPSKYERGFSESMQEIYEVAENLLNAGMDIRSVAARTKLPASEVQMLARMVKQESESRHQEVEEREEVVNSSQAEHDPRLGVLGGMRRLRQTL
ncbi:MAG: hypothetical protein KDD56_03890 [Bdellovibrionales bacterium]|nr:hypothetical protein [Bdellovibrionales bacterium]